MVRGAGAPRSGGSEVGTSRTESFRRVVLVPRESSPGSDLRTRRAFHDNLVPRVPHPARILRAQHPGPPDWSTVALSHAPRKRCAGKASSASLSARPATRATMSKRKLLEKPAAAARRGHRRADAADPPRRRDTCRAAAAGGVRRSARHWRSSAIVAASTQCSQGCRSSALIRLTGYSILAPHESKLKGWVSISPIGSSNACVSSDTPSASGLTRIYH